jgi:hypothetical protein
MIVSFYKQGQIDSLWTIVVSCTEYSRTCNPSLNGCASYFIHRNIVFVLEDSSRGHISQYLHALGCKLNTETECVVSLESKRRSNEVREYESSTAPICSRALVIGLAAGTTCSGISHQTSDITNSRNTKAQRKPLSCA